MTIDEAREGLTGRRLTIFNVMASAIELQSPGIPYSNVRTMAIKLDNVLLSIGDETERRRRGTTPAPVFLVMSSRVAEPVALRSTREGAHEAIRELVETSRWESFHIVEREVPS